MTIIQANRKQPWYKALLGVAKILTRKASPALFAITMGTGSVSNLFYGFPYGNGSKPMLTLSLIVFFLNLAFYGLFTVLVALKYTLYSGKWSRLIQDPVTSLYIACFPMGATTLFNVAVDVINVKYNVGGKGFLYFVWALWWSNVVISFLCCWLLVHVMITRQKQSLDGLTAIWVLPVVTLIVCSSSGGILARALHTYSSTYALNTATLSVFMVVVGLTLASMILTAYLLRLITHGLPQGATILSVFIPLGPTGQAGYAFLLIGQNYNSLLPISTLKGSSFLGGSMTGAVVNVACTCVALILWSIATMWFLYAILALYSSFRHSRISFKLSNWGLVFPNGVYANLTIQLGNTFDSRAFRIWGSIYAVAVLLLWLSISIRSLWEVKMIFTKERLKNAVTSANDESKQASQVKGESNRTSFTQVA
ncbi:voltage-dependent anion channel [Crassisporium funariophilum]|nr:voltage-dependent anion channel [Crassisporium funariophilum]